MSLRSLGDVLRLSREHLRDRGISSPRLDAELLAAHALGTSRLQLYLQLDRPLTEAELQRLRPLIRRRAAREPVAHILEHREFYGLDFRVRPGLLVPRPDTETLVEALLAVLPEEPGPPVHLADIGCGTGCVGLTLARLRPRVRVFAVDRNPDALRCTRENAEALEVRERVALLQGDLLDAVPPDRSLDWVISNPPYIPTDELVGLPPEIRRYEDPQALDGGPDGLAVIRNLVDQAATRARSGLALEVDPRQREPVVDRLRQRGFLDIAVREDLGGRPRVVTGRSPRRPPAS